MKHLNIVHSVLLLLASATASAAPVLSFGENGQDYSYTAYEGDNLDVPIWISGLDPENLGGFDISVNFDESVIDFVETDFTPLTLIGSFVYEGTNSPGEINVAAISMDWDLTSQPASFQIATFTLSAASAGTGQLDFTDVLLSDDFGFELMLADSYIADINVLSAPLPPTPVPGPPVAGLLLFSLVLMPLRRQLLKS